MRSGGQCFWNYCGSNGLIAHDLKPDKIFICRQLHKVCRGWGCVIVFPFPVFFPCAKRGLHCLENGFIQWLDDICEMGGGHNHLYTPEVHFLKSLQRDVCFAAIHQ